MGPSHVGVSNTQQSVEMISDFAPQSKFRIQFDSTVYIHSAFATQTLFQQPLFGWTFNNSGLHFISFQALYNEQGNATQWLDLDYILIAADDGTPS